MQADSELRSKLTETLPACTVPSHFTVFHCRMDVSVNVQGAREKSHYSHGRGGRGACMLCSIAIAVAAAHEIIHAKISLSTAIGLGLLTASAFCQQLIPCLAGNCNLARVCRNLNSWGCRVGCAIPDDMVTDVHMSLWDAQQCSRPQKCKCV